MLPFVLTIVPLLAQSVPASQNDELVRAAKNPYDLARFIDSHFGFDWDLLWKTIGAANATLQPCGTQFGAHYAAELTTVLNPEQTILAVRCDFPQVDIYMQFLKQSAGGWRLAGVVGALARFHPGHHSVDRSTATPFLRIRHDGSHGSGLDSEFEDWYDLTRPGSHRVFSSITQGNRTDGNPQAFGIAREVQGQSTARENSIDVMLEVRFSGVDESGEHGLGVSVYHAIYARRAPTKSFSIQTASADVSRASISTSDFETLADLDKDPSNEELIRLDLHGLTAVATGKDSAAKNYLKELLRRSKDTPEVRKLKALLR